MTAVVVALAVAVVLLGLLVAGLLRSHAEILRALHELGAGLELDRAAPAAAGPQPLVLEPFRATTTDERPTHLSGTTLDDEAVSLPLQSSRDTLVAFLSSGCSTCQSFWDTFAGEPYAVPGGAQLVVVAQDLAEESGSALRQRAGADLTLLLSSETWAEFGVPGSPYFVYVDGRTGASLGEGSAATWAQVSDLMGQALADHTRRDDPGGGRHRLQRDDAALLAAGIGPGDPSLHVDPDARA